MNYSQTLLTKLKDAQGLASDNRVAQILGCTRQHISLIKKGKSGLSEEMAIKVATMAGIDPKSALISVMFDRAESEEMREVLKQIEEKISDIKQ